MSRCIYKDIAKNLNKEEFKKYYLEHINKDVCEHFNFHPRYLYRILEYFNIDRGSHEKLVASSKIACTPERNKKISLSNTGREFSQETRRKISESQKGKVITYKDKISNTLKGHIPWNKGLKNAQKWSDSQREKYFNTLKERNWFNKSKVEDDLYNDLINKYGKDNIIRQYKDEKRYPFNCDFYIKSEDLFIELNRWWHHGPHKFNLNNKEDLDLLEEWKIKAKSSKQYENAIHTWTIRDIEKYEIAEKNNLNYLVIY